MATSTLDAPPRSVGSSEAPAIDAQQLTKTYRGGTRALDRLTFQVAPGTVFALLGPNGAGKSTAVKVLTTLSRPDSGQARVAGTDVLRHPDRVRRVIGVVSQKSTVDPEATGWENLKLQGHLYQMSGADLAARVSSLIDRFNLGQVADKIVKTYSGGTERKLNVAVGLVHRPKVLFLDEPTTGLDPEARAEMWREISRLATDEGVTVLLTTHYMEEADRLSDQVAIMDKGRVVVQGTAEQLKSELHGDAVVVQLADQIAPERVLAAIDQLTAVLHEPSVDRRILRARVDSGASALPAVLAALDSARLAVSTASVLRPSLDDVYLRYTGRTFASNEEDSR
jgi:ABC-2 type transport system ATP-binding protein